MQYQHIKKILDLDPSNLIAINNLGYALSKSKDYQNALSYYDYGLQQHPNEKTLLINKISASRKMAMLDYALDSCNTILSKSPNDLIVLYHKLRILYVLKEYEQSLEICDKILLFYPNNGDVLFDKVCNLISLDRNEECLKSLNEAIKISNKFKLKAKKNKIFKKLEKNQNFINLMA